MSSINRHVKHYELEVSLDGSRGNGPDAVLYLYGEGRALLAAVAFRESGDPIVEPPVEKDGLVAATLPTSAMHTLMDVLRNERPIVLCWDAAAGALRLTTQQEPVGEAELRRLFSWMYI